MKGEKKEKKRTSTPVRGCERKLAATMAGMEGGDGTEALTG